MSDDPYKARDRVVALISSLPTMVQRDPEQEVRGMAVPVLDAAMEAIQMASQALRFGLQRFRAGWAL